ncbi:hypothetical protein [Micromonospora globbae]|uniref:hypothetical protein n=1 Tax=Micromonospora globbae TaxID=1894969 RepID=UPI0013158C1E|nr:hypothetical protein [Micromonospora globbae]
MHSKQAQLDLAEQSRQQLEQRLAGEQGTVRTLASRLAAIAAGGNRRFGTGEQDRPEQG